jgi:tetratricopeptide (TPR) repeat protein
VAYQRLVEGALEALKPLIEPVLYDEVAHHLEQYQRGGFALTATLLDTNPSETMEQIWTYRIDSLYTDNPAQSANQLRMGLRRAHQALPALVARRAYLEAARVALVAHDWMHTLERLAGAAGYARFAEAILERHAHQLPSDARNAAEGYYAVNARYAHGVTLRMLNRHAEARSVFERLQSAHPQSPWFPHAQREALMTRLDEGFHLESWLKAWDRHRKTLDVFSGHVGDWDVFTARRIRAQALLLRGSVKQAMREYRALLDELEQISGVTLLHRVALRRRYAEALVRVGEREAALDELVRLKVVAEAAGFTHQLGLLMPVLGALNARQRSRR